MYKIAMVALKETSLVLCKNLRCHKSVRAFRMTYLFLALLSFNSLLLFSAILKVLTYIVALWGLLIVGARVLSVREYIHFPHIKVLALFLLSAMLSMIISAHIDYLEGIQGLIWLTLEFFVLFLWEEKDNSCTVKDDLFLLACLFVGYCLFSSFVSLVLALFGFSFSNTSNIMQQQNIGIVAGRLWGIYSDPNYGGVLALVSIYFSLILHKCKPSKIVKITVIVNLFVQFFYISLSGSRTAFVASVVSLGFLILAYWLKSVRFGGIVIRFGLATFSIIAASIMLYALMFAVSSGYNNYGALLQEQRVKAWEEVQELIESETATQEEIDLAKKKSEQLAGVGVGLNGETGIAQRDSASKDISSGRINIWKDALRIFKDNPITGVSYRAIGAYVQAEMPNSFLAKKGYTSMHNVFIDVSVGQGLIGLILWIYFIVSCIKDIFLLLRKLSGDDWIKSLFCVAIMVSIASSAIFYSEIIYINTAGSVVFWLLLGYLMVLASDYETNLAKD